MGPAVVLGENLAGLPRPVGDGAAADLAARDRKLRHSHGEAAGTRLAHHIHDASTIRVTLTPGLSSRPLAAWRVCLRPGHDLPVLFGYSERSGAAGRRCGLRPGSVLTAWRRTPADLAEPPLRHRHGRPPRARGTPSRLVHARMNGEDVGQLDNGKNPQHLVLRRGQQQVTPGAPGLHPRERQRRHSAGVDELQTGQVNDYLRRTGRDRHQRGGDARGVYYVKLPTQGNDNLTVAFAGTQSHTDHGSAFLRLQQGGVSTRQQVRHFSP
jgi:hypothetical protein